MRFYNTIVLFLSNIINILFGIFEIALIILLIAIFCYLIVTLVIATCKKIKEVVTWFYLRRGDNK
jgi:hypothetical protein